MEGIDVNQYKDEFLQEAREYIELFNNALIKLEKGDKEAVNEIFRAAHTLKGMAGFMGYKNLEELCHKFENVLGEIRDGNIEPTSEIIDLMLETVDLIEEIVDKVEQNEDVSQIEVDHIIKSLESLCAEEKADKSKRKAKKGRKPKKAKRGSDDKEKSDKKVLIDSVADYNMKIDITLSESCSMKSVRAILIIETLKDFGKVVKTEPSEEDIDKERFDRKFTVFLKTDKNKKDIEKAIKSIGEIESFEIKEVLREPCIPEDKKDDKKEKISKFSQKRIEKPSLESIRVNIEQLDNIMNLVGELVISKGRLLQIAQQYDIRELREAVSIMEKAITSLQDEVMRIRMVKIEKIFSKFPRMVRDLSRKLGKKIEFTMEGLETELDRTVLDEISEPLVHLVRNAVDHGIESPEERVKAGKSEVGHIKLSAKREKNNIIIEIEDDGRGIDPEKIRKKAIKLGLISPDESVDEERLKMLLFEPGFSTKEDVTEISGRGVGLDVVKTKIERLGGTVKLFSEKGKGTRIVITLPPTVAIVKSLLVKVADETYAIPISNVLEALYLNDENFKIIQGNKVLYVRGKIIPAISLRELFGIKNGNPEREVGIIVEKEGEKFALIVDAIEDQQEIVIKPLGKFLNKVKGFGGVTILGDGRVIPIIDVTTLLWR